MAWFFLFLAGLAEIGWALGMKHSNGFTHIPATIFTLVLMAVSVALLAVAVKTIPLGTAYAVWTGIGIVGTVVYGIVTKTEALSVAKTICLLMVIGGVVGLKLLSGESSA